MELLSKCCDNSTRWVDCPDCLAVGYTECFALKCEECGALDTDHVQETPTPLECDNCGSPDGAKWDQADGSAVCDYCDQTHTQEG